MPGPLDLLGRWTLERTIEDRREDETLHVTGTTTLTAESPDRVCWSEEGTLVRAGGARVPVTRTLYVVRRDDGWWVTFEDGRDFHPWRPGATVDHPCAPDHYRGRVDVPADPALGWTVTWEVSGPHKDYTMRTVLRPGR
jgi:hypothetical protein